MNIIDTSCRLPGTIYKDLSGYTPTWCPGCGDWGIVRSIKLALDELGIGPAQVAVCFDIGCSGNMNDFLYANSMHTLHGRSIPTATGIKLTRPELPVIAIGGDGATYGEGGNHFLHACRGNHDITMIVHDNMVYGLTTGQTAPTANIGHVSPSTPFGTRESAVNPLALAITQGATFVAQGFANNVRKTSQLIKRAIQHKGFSLVNILQPCVTFNKKNTYRYFSDRVYELDDTYDPHDQQKALITSLEPLSEKFPLGILYHNTTREPYHVGLSPVFQERDMVYGIDTILKNIS